MPRKGVIAVGADADLAIWDPNAKRTVTASMLHDAVGYTPYEGRDLTGWPETVISRGEVIVDDGKLKAVRGRGRYLAREHRPSRRCRPARASRRWRSSTPGVRRCLAETVRHSSGRTRMPPSKSGARRHLVIRIGEPEPEPTHASPSWPG